MRASGRQLDAGEGLPAGCWGPPTVPLSLVLPTDPHLHLQILKGELVTPKLHL